MSKNFKALVVNEDPSGNFIYSIQKRRVADLPKGDLMVRVEYSSLNSKDALSATGNKDNIPIPLGLMLRVWSKIHLTLTFRLEQK